MKPFIPAFFLSLFCTSPALALTVATCTEKLGCSCASADASLTLEDAALLVGSAPPAGIADPVVVFAPGNAPAAWSVIPANDVDILYGGNGSCTGPMIPEDGVWTAKSRLNRISCGTGTAMMAAMLKGNLAREKPARVAWGGTFDPETYRKAWLAANPDPEASRPTWKKHSEHSFSGEDRLEGLVSRYKMELLSPTLIRSDWQIEGTNAEGLCTWDITNFLSKTAD